MIANFLEYFYTSKFDDKTILINQDKSYTIADLKILIKDKIQNPQNRPINFSKCSIFEFIVEFIARIFIQEEINLYQDLAPIDKNSEFDFISINPNKVDICFSTSGSSGNPKVVVKTLANLVAESQDILSQFPELRNMEFVSTTTLNHLFGFTFHFMLPLNGGGMINCDSISIPEDINKKDVCLISTPSFLEILAKYNYKLQKNPKIIISAGAELKSEIFTYTKSISTKTIEIYGSTETGVMAFRMDSEAMFKLFCNINLLKSNGSICIETPYSKNSPVIVQDKIELLPNQYIKFLGRNDRVYKVREKRISAEILENLIRKNPHVKDVYTFKWENKLASLGVLSDSGLEYLYKYGMVELIKNIKSSLLENVDIIPQKWKFWDEIPHSENGKIKISEIFELFSLNLSMPLPVKRQMEKDFAIISLYFYKNCNFFKGHFDGFHIVPGIVQLFLAQYYSSKIFKIPNISGQYRKIKFKNIIKPDKVINLVLERTAKGIVYSYKDEEKIYSSGVLPLVGFEGKD